MTNSKSNNPRVIQSIQRALDIIDCFTKSNTELSLNDISKKLSLNKSTTHGIINTLHINGYIEQNVENGKYMLGKKLMIKGLLVSDSISIRLKDVAIKYLKILTEKYSSTTHIFSYKNKVLSFVEKITPSNAYYIVSSVIGKEMPLHATASGKIVLAHMPEDELVDYLERKSLEKFTKNTLIDIDKLKEELVKIRVNGYCMEDEEVEMGVFSISTPIYDNHRLFIGTISLTAPAGKVKDMTEEIVMDIKNSSKKITESLFG